MYRDFLAEASLLYAEDSKFTRDIFSNVLKDRVKNLYVVKDGLEQLKKTNPMLF